MPDDATYAKRIGFWLRMARERSGKSQKGAAEHLGFSTKSKSTISDYESGVTVPSLPTLRKLAAWYGVPLAIFTDPQATPEERLDEIVQLAAAEERARYETEGERARGAGDEPDAGRRTRSA